jgi:hypothetical protein
VFVASLKPIIRSSTACFVCLPRRGVHQPLVLCACHAGAFINRSFCVPATQGRSSTTRFVCLPRRGVHQPLVLCACHAGAFINHSFCVPATQGRSSTARFACLPRRGPPSTACFADVVLQQVQIMISAQCV